jgi:tetratricopeptide (TPR) repeat protein
VPILPLLAIRSRTDRRGEPVRADLLRGGALLGAVVLVLLPVAVRNAWVGGGLLPTTFQGGVNYWIGNNPEATGGYQPLVVGRQIPAHERREPVRIAERELGRQLTGAEVSRYWFTKAFSWAFAEPADFASLQLRKLRMFWSFREEADALDYDWVRTISPVLRLPLLEFGAVALLAGLGLGWLRERGSRFLPILLFVAVWTMATVAFFVFGRYRLPVVPGLLLLAALPIHRLLAALRERDRVRAAALGAFCLLAWLLPLALPRAPATALVEFNLGTLYERAGDLAAAERAYRAALAADPKEHHAAMNLGHLALRAGRLADARTLFSYAVELAPGFVDAWSSLGVAEVRLGDLDRAEESFRRALELQPDHLESIHNRSVIALERQDASAARELNRRALELDPEYGPALRVKELLSQPVASGQPG